MTRFRSLCERALMLFCAVFLLQTTIFSQLSVNESISADSIASLITGRGVEIKNVSVTCSEGSLPSGRGYGSYNAGTNSMGLSEGLLLTTGKASSAIGPNSAGGFGTERSGTISNSNTTKKLLENYSSGKSVKEFCKFEFDLVPQGDTIRFDYMFASEEYNEYVGSIYNDMFGFFISGPGITADANGSGRKNIALIPGSTTPVSINTVNAGLSGNACNNCNYFVQNPPSSSYLQYDGYTKNLVAVSKVLPCSTYKLELIIADCGDKKYDSGVFIEKIRSNVADVTVSTVGGINDAIEGCNAGIFKFTRPVGSSNTKNVNINYWLSGTALNGIDYSQIGPINPLLPRTVTIPAGQNSVNVMVNAIADGFNEPTENVNLTLYNYTCPLVQGNVFTLNIRDSIYSNISPKNPVACEDEPVIFSSTNAVTYTWGPSASVISTSGANATIKANTTQSISVVSKVSQCTETKTTTLYINPKPLSKTILDPIKPCIGGLTELIIPNSQNGISYQLVQMPAENNIGTPVMGNGQNVKILTSNISAATTYNVYATNPVTGCYKILGNDVVVSPVSAPTQLALNNDERKCLVAGNDWVVFTVEGTGRALMSIHPNNQNLGWVNVKEFVNGATQNLQACNTDPINQPQFTTAALGRSWVVTPENQPNGNVRVRLFVSQTDILATSAAAAANANPDDDFSGIGSLVLTKYSGPNEDASFANNCNTGGVTTLHNQTASANMSSLYPTFFNQGRYVEYQVSSFSELWLHGTNASNPSPLPVVLSDWSNECGTEGVKLFWETQSEVNNDYFMVEYSEDASVWSEIAKVSGQGNSNTNVQYTFQDIKRRSSVGYYRLSQFDYNGTSEVFPVISSLCESSNEISWVAFPNPNNGTFSIKWNGIEENMSAQVRIYDMTGKQVFQKELQVGVDGQMELIQAQTLSAGAYFVRIAGEGFEGLKPIKVVIQ